MKQALEGLRVTDLTIITAGAGATQMLADLGAEVIKIEAGSYPDPFRAWAGTRSSEEDPPPDPWNWAPTFNMVNRNKRAICLDLKMERGREVFLELVRASDIVTENFRQGVMDRLGVGYDVLRSVNPKIIMISLGSQGSTGPESRYGSYGSTLDALSGLMGITGYTDSHPVWSSGEVNYPDQVAALFGAGILLAAIRQRDKTGQGTYIDLSQREMMTNTIGEYVLQYTVDADLPVQQGNRYPCMAPHDCYRCAGENDWVAIAISSDEEWQALSMLIGRSNLAVDERFRGAEARWEHQDLLRQPIEEWTVTRSKHDVMTTLQRAGIKVGAVLTGAEMLTDPHLNARGYYQTVVNHRSGSQTLRVAPYTLSETPPRINWPAPVLGQDTTSVLRDVLNLSNSEIAELEELGVTAAVPRASRSRAAASARTRD